MRAPVANHIAVRLADEGVPVAAIARALLCPFAEVTLILKEALEAGHLIDLPPSEWTRGTARDNRPGPDRFIPKGDWVATLQLALRITPSEARILSFMLSRQLATKNALHSVSQVFNHETEPKIVDVFICKLRKKLRPLDITIGTIWGRGYFIPPASRAKITALTAAYDFDQAPISPFRTSPDAHRAAPA